MGIPAVFFIIEESEHVTCGGKPVEKKRFYNGRYEWIQVDQQDSSSIARLQRQHQLTDEMLTYSLDKNERARVEFDTDDQALLLVFNVPQQEKKDNHFETSPMTFILKKDRLFTFFFEKYTICDSDDGTDTRAKSFANTDSFSF